MEELSELLLQRRRKLDALWEAGINPYPNDYKAEHTSADLFAVYGSRETIEDDPQVFVVAGRIVARGSPRELREGSGEPTLTGARPERRVRAGCRR